MLRRCLFGLVVVLRFWQPLACSQAAAEQTAADILPPTTVLFVEANQPKAVVDFAVDHPLSLRIRESAEYKHALESKDYLQFRAAVAIAEAELGIPWRKAVDSLASGGIALAIDAKTNGVALLSRAADESLPKKLIDSVAHMVQADTRRKGHDDPVKSAAYRDITAYELNQIRFAAAGSWLIVCNNDQLGKGLLDRMLDGGESLATAPAFQEALRRREDGSHAWAFVDVAAIRKAGAAQDLFRGPVDNPVAELLLGGVFANLQKTAFAMASLSLKSNHVSLVLSAPHDRTWVGENRDYYFGPEGKGVAPRSLAVKDTLFALSTYRDVSGMWLRAGDLFNDQITGDLAKADSQLTTLFSGKDFGEDILGAFHPDFQLVVVGQSFATAKIQPAIKLPAFGVVFRLRDPATMQPELRRTYQSLIGFLNIVGAMDGQPQLDMDIEKGDDRQLLASTYLPEAGPTNPLQAKLHFNFSPTVAFHGDRFVVSSTKELARELIGAETMVSGADETPTTIVNTEAVLHFAPVREVLANNRDQLVAQNMLEKGHSKEEAEREIDLLLSLLGMLRDQKIKLETDDNTLRLLLEFSFADEQR